MPLLFRKLYARMTPESVRRPLYRLRNRRELDRLRQAVFPSPKGDFSLKPFDELETIFVHVTKSAGTSVAMSLFGYLPYHYTARDYQLIYGRRDFNRYFKFAFVRNPWDRLYSAYRYLKAGGWNHDDQIWADNNLSEYNDFESFVLGWLTEANIKKHIHFWPQSEFLCDRNNRLLVDFVGRFEHLRDDLALVAERLNRSVTLQSLNMNPGNRYQDAYTSEMSMKVANVYRNDIANFRYTFDKQPIKASSRPEFGQASS